MSRYPSEGDPGGTHNPDKINLFVTNAEVSTQTIHNLYNLICLTDFKES
jgi:hypothetical protein